MTTATSLDLGSLGRAVTVTPPAKEGPRPHPIVVLDISSSMGEWASAIANGVVPRALSALGYREDDRATLIIFHSKSERIQVDGHDPTIAQLRTVDASARGCTYMADAFDRVVQAINELPPTAPVQLVGLSDGAIGDTAEVLKRSAAAAAHLKSRPGLVAVALVRWAPSSYAQADTRALASLGVLATDGAVPLHESRDGDELAQQLSCIDVGGAAQLTGLALRRMPGAAPTTALALPRGRPSTVLMDGPGPLFLDGAEIVPEEVPLEDEAQLRLLLEYLGEQLKMRLVVGRADMDRDLDWLERLRARLDELDPAPAEDDPHARSTAARVLRLKRQIRRRHAGLLGRILELRNRSDVAQLNANQQAAFLRGELREQSSAARRLAKRADDADPDETAQAVASELASIPALDMANAAADAAADAAASSFYSLETVAESLEGARALAHEPVTAAELLTVLGGLGVAFEAAVEPLPDPWAVRVRRVYLGDMLLSEQDRCAATGDQATGEARDLHFPGLPKPALVTGVVPLPGLYDRAPQLAPLARLHASISLRGLIAPVPHDRLARDAAVAVAASRQVGPTRSTVERRRLADLWGLVRGQARVLADVREHLARPDPRAWLTGDVGIAGPLKPLTALAAQLPRPPRPQAVWAVYLLEALALFRRVDWGDAGTAGALARLLGIELEQQLTPLFELDPPLASVEVDWPGVRERARALEWLPDVDRVLDVLAAADPADPADPDSDSSDVTVDHLGGLARDTLRTRVAIELLVCPTETERVDREARRCRAPQYHMDAAWERYVEDRVVQMLRDNRRRLERAKHAAEEADLLRRRVELALATDSLEQFMEQLVHVPSRSSAGYAQLEAGLLDRARAIPERQVKIEVVVLGRSRDDRPVWAGGCGMVAPAAKFHAFQQAYESAGYQTTGQHPWEEVARRHRLNMRHRYREKMENRHGHSNDRPSYFGYGYTTLVEFLAAVPADEQARYLREHADCCGVPDYLG